MKVFAKFDEIPSMILEVIKETKRYGHTFGRTVVRSFGRSDNMKREKQLKALYIYAYTKADMLSFKKKMRDSARRLAFTMQFSRAHAAHSRHLHNSE